MTVPAHIFRSYDIRGLYPQEVNKELVYEIARAYTKLFSPKKVVIGRDVRESGPELQAAVIQGFVDCGVDVIDIGIVTTDEFYFAVGTLPVDGGMTVSASHNPREWNGLNICKKGAEPISGETGLQDIRKLLESGEELPTSDRKGVVEKQDISEAFLTKVVSLIDYKNLKPFKIVANPSFGFDYVLLDQAVKLFNLPLTLIPLNAEPDGTFPKGHPNPLLEENRKEFTDLVIAEGADLGVAWDADGDRVFFSDEKGNFIEGYFTTALLATEVLKKHKGGKVLIDPRLIWASSDAIRDAGGEVIITKPGMTLIADKMKSEGAVFAGEMSGHFYFVENFNRDNGLIPLFLVLEMLTKYNKPLSSFVEPFTSKYFISGEINFELENKDEIIEIMKSKYSDGKHEFIDGLSVEYPTWRFNLRKSNTEPLIRLNVEAKSKGEVDEKTNDIIALIEQNKK